MNRQHPIVVGLALDHEADEVLTAAHEIGRRLGCPIVVVHALAERRLENERGLSARVQSVQQALAPMLEKLRGAGLEVIEEIKVGVPARLVLETAQRLGAELIVAGGGRRTTVRRWMVGSVAEAIVRRAFAPVWVARGVPPIGQPVLCPFDHSPQAARGLAAALRMARLLDAPLRLLTVLPEASSDDDRDHEEVENTRRAIQASLRPEDVEGLKVEIVVVRGVPATRIVDASDDAGLLVVGSRGFDPLVPEWLGPTTTRALRGSRCSVLTVREVDVDLERSRRAIVDVADDYRAAWALIEDDRALEALPLIERAAARALVNPVIQEAYAIALERVGRKVEARGRHELARMIRSRIGSG